MAGGEPPTAHASARPRAAGLGVTGDRCRGEGRIGPVIRLPLMRMPAGFVLAIVLAGGLAPAVFGAITGSLLVSFGFLLLVRTITGAMANDAAVLGVLIAVAVAAVIPNRYPRSRPEGNEHGTAH